MSFQNGAKTKSKGGTTLYTPGTVETGIIVTGFLNGSSLARSARIALPAASPVVLPVSFSSPSGIEAKLLLSAASSIVLLSGYILTSTVCAATAADTIG